MQGRSHRNVNIYRGKQLSIFFTKGDTVWRPSVDPVLATVYLLPGHGSMRLRPGLASPGEAD